MFVGSSAYAEARRAVQLVLRSSGCVGRFGMGGCQGISPSSWTHPERATNGRMLQRSWTTSSWGTQTSGVGRPCIVWFVLDLCQAAFPFLRAPDTIWCLHGMYATLDITLGRRLRLGTPAYPSSLCRPLTAPFSRPDTLDGSDFLAVYRRRPSDLSELATADPRGGNFPYVSSDGNTIVDVRFYDVRPRRVSLEAATFPP